MTKRQISILIGVLCLAFMFFIMLTAVIAMIALHGRLPMVGRATIALVKVEGMIIETTDEIRQIQKYANNPMVDAIVLRINSPGGAVGGSQELYSAIRKIRRQSEKPIVASMGNVAASGGLYVAVAADEVIANPGTVTGSIGVIFQTYDVQGISKKIGVGVNTIKSGKFKDTGSMFRDMSPEERKIIQETIDDTYDQFLEAVLDARFEQLRDAYMLRGDGATSPTAGGDTATTESAEASTEALVRKPIPRAAVKAYLKSIADGRIFSGRQAKAYGLVDNLGGLQDAIDRATELAGKRRGRPTILQERRKQGLWDLMQSRAEALGRLAARDGLTLEYRLCFD